MLRFLLPKDISFFEHFDEHIALTIEGAKELLALTSNGGDLDAFASRIKDAEHKTDLITHRCVADLHKTFITPIDRAAIHSLIKRLDDIMDFADSAASRMALYKLTQMRPEARQQAEVLLKAAEQLQQAIKGLRNLKNAHVINTHCIAVHGLENEGDTILNGALARLFNSDEDPILVIKWKEIFESLEKAIDRCQDVAIVIEGIVLEAS
jgi:uncharacterized protein